MYTFHFFRRERLATNLKTILIGGLLAASGCAPSVIQQSAQPLDRSALPIPEPKPSIYAEIEVPQDGAQGAILVQGGRFGGWALYVKGGRPACDYNFLGLQRFTVASSEPLAPGKASIRFELEC